MRKHNVAWKLIRYIEACQRLIELSELHIGKGWVCGVCNEESHKVFARQLAHLLSCELGDREEHFNEMGEMDAEYYKSALDNAANVLEIKAELSEIWSELNDYIVSDDEEDALEI